MKTRPITVRAARAQLSRLIERARNGEEIVLVERDVPVVRLVPIAPRTGRPRFGAMKGLARTDESFFEPLDKDELDSWG